MGLWSKILFGGIDLDEEQAKQSELDAALRQQNQIALEQGRISQDVFDQTEAHIAGSEIDVKQEVSDVFYDALDYNMGELVELPKKTVPWWVWAVGLVVVLGWLGFFRR